MYFAKHITNGRCVDDIIYINLSSFESASNSLLGSSVDVQSKMTQPGIN